MKGLFLILTALCAYFLGGINGAIIASKYLFRQDVRRYGSGNAGLTNFYRTYGAAGLLLVLGVDIGKSVLALLIGKGLLGLTDMAAAGCLYAGFFLILGHFYPAFYQFRGGKGVLCAGVIAVMTDWRVGLFCLLIFALVLACTRYISLGSMLGTFSFPFLLFLFGHRDPWELGLAVLCVAAVIWKHSPNIRRLMQGTESRFAVKKRGDAGEKSS